MESRKRIRPGWALTLLGLSVVIVVLSYGDTLDFGFHYDDYHVLRPWRWRELRQVWVGTWDPTGIEVPFYRPITAWFYALRFHLFGLNAVPQRVMTLIGLVACTWMVAVYAWRETMNRQTAIVAAVLYSVHPALVYGQAVWLTNQMHLLASVVVLGALLIWVHARGRSPSTWWPLFALQLLAFGIKEDTIVLLALLVP